jgi:hypothetical protein
MSMRRDAYATYVQNGVPQNDVISTEGGALAAVVEKSAVGVCPDSFAVSDGAKPRT